VPQEGALVLDCIKVPRPLCDLCEEYSLLARKSLNESVIEALTDWLEAQTGKTISELLGVEESNDEHLPISLMARTA
jgi:hypothetical protein